MFVGEQWQMRTELEVTVPHDRDKSPLVEEYQSSAGYDEDDTENNDDVAGYII